MKAIYPNPLLPICLFLFWLLLNDSLSLGQMVFGLLLAVLVSVVIRPLRPLVSQPRRPHRALILSWHVLIDIIRSNITVAGIVLCADQTLRPDFLKIPLTMRDPHGLAALSIIITATPGTAWANYDPKNNVLFLHILDLQDEEKWIRIITQRYEKPLMEIFE